MFDNLQSDIKLFIGTIISVSLIIWSWHVLYSLSYFSLLSPLLILAIISSSFIDIKMHERTCFKNCYFQEKSFFAKILGAKLGTILFYIILSIALTLSITYAIISFPYQIWFYLPFHTLFIIFMYKFLFKFLKNTIKEKYLKIISRVWTMNLASILLFFVYSFIFYNGYEPDYLVNDLLETIKNASNSISSDCLYIDYFLRLNTELDGTFWWIVTYSSQTIDNQTIKSAIWISFIVLNALAVLGINRLIVQIVYLLDKLFSRDTIEY